MDTPVILKQQIEFLIIKHGHQMNPSRQDMTTIKVGTIGNVMSNGMDGEHVVRFYGIKGGEYVDYCDVRLSQNHIANLNKEEWDLYEVLYG